MILFYKNVASNVWWSGEVLNCGTTYSLPTLTNYNEQNSLIILNLFKNFQFFFLVILCFLSISYRNKKSNKKKFMIYRNKRSKKKKV